MIDNNGFKMIDSLAQETKNAVDKGQWTEATYLWSATESIVVEATNNIDFYNVLNKVNPISNYKIRKYSEGINESIF